ncbi:MAG: MarR family transcriptional regulator [Clostridiales bacterium]|nr:MarR family transcriptional regulator [Clostridiales bacterium]
MTSELYEKLTQLQWLLNKQQIRAWAVNGPMADTTRGQGRILAVLKLKDGISTKDLSYLLGLRISSLNELLSKMEKGGYVTREPSEQDKRVMLVKLTEKGRNKQQQETFGISDVFSCLSEEEQELLGEYLDRIIAALHERFGAQGDEMLEKMEALRERFGNMGGFFGGRER